MKFQLASALVFACLSIVSADNLACPVTSGLESPQLEKAYDCWKKFLEKKTFVENGLTGDNVVHESELPANARVVGLDTRPPVDYIPTRLNIRKNADGVIDRVTLG